MPVKHIYEIPITPEMLARATEFSEKVATSATSFTKGDGKLAGYLGYEMYAVAFPGAIFNRKNNELDITNGLYKIMPRTIRTSVIPKSGYNALVAKVDVPQMTDIYAFIRVHYDNSVGWLCGWMFKEEFLKRAEFIVKGTNLGTGFAGDDCYKITLNNLYPFEGAKGRKIQLSEGN